MPLIKFTLFASLLLGATFLLLEEADDLPLTVHKPEQEAESAEINRTSLYFLEASKEDSDSGTGRDKELATLRPEWLANKSYTVLAKEVLPIETKYGYQENLILESPNGDEFLRVENTCQFLPGKDKPVLEKQKIMKADTILVGFADYRESKGSEILESTIQRISPSTDTGVIAEVAVKSPSMLNSIPDAIAYFESLESVRFVEPNFLVQSSATTPNDPLLPEQTYLLPPRHPAGINVLEGWDIKSTSPEVIVAILDTGMRMDHEDLSSNLWTNPDETVDGTDSDNNGYADDLHGLNLLDTARPPEDDNGHGTLIAGIIGARGDNGLGIAGISWDVQLMPIKCLNANGYGTTMDIILGIHYALVNGANVINASWQGSAYSLALEEALLQCNDAGVLFVTSAGNDGRDLNQYPGYPAVFNTPNLITVGALNRNGDHSIFSNYGEEYVHISAPGESLYSTAYGSESGYRPFSGTSGSAAMVSGCAALLLSLKEFKSPEALKYRILTTVHQFPSNPIATQSSGILDVAAALQNQNNQPDNDLLGNPAPLFLENPIVLGSFQGTTISPDDPSNHPDAVASVWYSYLPEKDHQWAVEILSSTHPVKLALFTADGEGFKPIGRIFGSGNQRAIAEVEFDNICYLQLSSESPDNYFVLKHSNAIENDDFRDALPLDPATRIGPVSNAAASREPAEPPITHGFGKTLWWRFTPVEDGSHFFSIAGSDSGTILAVFEGTGLLNLIPVASTTDSGNDWFLADLKADENYYLRADSSNSNGGNIQLFADLAQPVIPVNNIADYSANPGESVVLAFHTEGNLPAIFEWYRNGVILETTDKPELLLPTLTPEDYGTYTVIIRSEGGFIHTTSFQLNPKGRGPQILLHPESQTITREMPLRLVGYVDATAPISYQWYKNGEAITGAKQTTYTRTQADLEDAGWYHLEVSNNHGKAKSKVSIVQVNQENELLELDIQRPSPTRFGSAVTWFGNRFVLSGYPSYLLTSDEGYSWSASPPFTDQRVLKFTDNGNRIVAQLTGEKVATTTDLLNWRETKLTNEYFSSPVLSFAGKFFIAVGRNQVLSSEDGVDWTTAFQFPAGGENLNLAANNNYLLASKPGNPTTTFARSSDGVNWETWQETPEINYGDSDLYGIDNSFIMIGNRFWLASNGDAWREISWLPKINSWEYINGTYYVSGFEIGIYKSKDLETWEAVSRFEYETIDGSFDFAYHDGRAVVGPINGIYFPTSDLESIPHGSSFNLPEEHTTWKGIKYIDDEFVAFGDRGVKTSKTGFLWEDINSKPRPGDIYVDGGAVAFGNNTFAVGGYYGPSLDLLTYNPHAPSFIHPQTFGNGRFVAWSNDGLFHSQDGINWEPAELDGELFKGKIRFLGGYFIGIDMDDSLIIRSSDGVSWTKLSPPNTSSRNKLKGITYNGTHYLIITEDGYLIRSADGQTWEISGTSLGEFVDPGEINDAFFDIVFDGENYTVLGSNGIFKSTDTNFWSYQKLQSDGLEHLAYGNGVIMAAGTNGSLVRLDNPKNIPPDMQIISDSEFWIQPHESISLSVDAYDPDGAIQSVKFYEGTQLIEERTSKPFTLERAGFPVGVTYLTIIAEDNDGFIHREAVRVNTTSDNRFDVIGGTRLSQAEAAVEFNGTFFALSRQGSIYQSDSPGQWKQVFRPTNRFPGELKSLGGRMFAIADEGYYLTEDGLNWSYRGTIIEFPQNFRQFGQWYVTEITQNKNRGMAISEDGRGWHFLPEDPGFWDIVGGIGPDLYATSGREGYYRIYRNGESVETHPLPQGYRLNSILPYPGGYLMEVSDYQGPDYLRLLKSRDFETWEEVPLPESVLEIESIATIEDRIFMVSRDGTIWSADFKVNKWIKVGNNGPDSIRHTTYLNGYYYTLTTGGVQRSEDGITWSTVSESFQAAGEILGHKNGFVAFGYSGDSGQQIWSSPNGRNWSVDTSSIHNPNNYFRDITAGHAGYVVSSRDLIGHSDDGLTWTFRNNPGEAVGSVAYGNGVYVIAGEESYVLRSTDGKIWTSINVEPETHLDVGQVAFLKGADLFVMGGVGKYWTSSDGLNWTRHEGADEHDLFGEPRSVENVVYMLINGTVWRTSDGVNWTEEPMIRYSSTIAPLPKGGYIAVSGSVSVRISDDGIIWRDGVNPTSIGANGAVIDHGSYVVGCFGTYLEECWRTEDGIQWEQISNYQITAYSKRVGGNIYFLNDSIQVIIGSDLELEAATFADGDFAIGESVEVTISVLNSGLENVDLTDLEIDALLTVNEGWHGANNSTPLPTQSIGNSILEPGAKIDTTVAFEIPKGTPPGSYGVQLWLNPNQQIVETSLSNNFAWSGPAVVNIARVKVDVVHSEGAQVSILEGHDFLAQGEELNLFASVNEGYRFSHWNVETSQIVPQSATLVMDTSKAIEAVLEKSVFPTIYIVGHGTVSATPEKAVYTVGDDILLTAHPKPGWQFLSWFGSVQSEASTINWKIIEEEELVARFQQSAENYLESVLPISILEDEDLGRLESDADGDGYSNLFEILMISDPLNDSEIPRVFTLHDSSGIRIRFSKNSLIAGDLLQVEISDDLEIWTREGLEQEVVYYDQWSEIVEASASIRGTEKVFMRVVVEEK